MATATRKDAHAALIAGFERAIARALAQIEPADRDPETAVHEWRKALRRARSIVRLARPFLGGTTEAQVAAALRAGHKAGAELRDTDVLAGALSTAGEPAATLARRVNAVRERQRARGAAHARLSAHAGAVAALPERFSAALAPEIGVGQLARGLAKSYRRVRRAARRAGATRTAADLHAFRRRVKAFEHQLEVAEAVRGLDARDARRGAARLAHALGEITDGLLVARLVTHSKGGLSDVARKRLIGTLSAQRVERIDRVLSDGATLTAARPGRFRRRLRAGS